MRKTTILVTGGAGYVGAVLVPKLLTIGYVVKIVDRYLFGETVKRHGGLIQIHADLRDKKKIREALEGVDAVIHLAAISNDPSFELDPDLAKTINFDATRFLIDEARDRGIRRFIFASSSSVYGIKKEKEVTEDLPLEPLTDYSKYKALAEEYLLTRQTKDFVPVILRPATVCGYSKRMRLDLTVNILTINALVNGSMTVFGGSQKRPNIHIKDMADAYCLVLGLADERVAGQVYNVGYENYTVMELARMVKRVVSDETIEITIKPTTDLRSYHISSKKIERALGFKPAFSLEEAIHDIQEAYTKGYLSDPLTDAKYYNIKTLQRVGLQ